MLKVNSCLEGRDGENHNRSIIYISYYLQYIKTINFWMIVAPRSTVSALRNLEDGEPPSNRKQDRETELPPRKIGSIGRDEREVGALAVQVLTSRDSPRTIWWVMVAKWVCRMHFQANWKR